MGKKTCFFLAFAATLLACQTKPKQETESGKAPVADSAAILAQRPGPDTPRSAADRLIRALYFEHNKTENPFREKKDRALIDQFFAKPTADLIWNDAQKASGRLNRTKTNLLYNASDSAVKKTWVLPALVGGSRAIVYVTFEENGKPQEIKIDMQQIAGRWRITEMIYPNGKHLTEMLK